MTLKQFVWTMVLLAALVAGWCLVGLVADGPAKGPVSHSEPRSRLIGTSG